MSAETPETLFEEDRGQTEGLSHKDALNALLAHSCSNPAYYPDDKKTREYKIELCCDQMFVLAQPVEGGYVIIDVLSPSRNASRVAKMREQGSLKV